MVNEKTAEPGIKPGPGQPPQGENGRPQTPQPGKPRRPILSLTIFIVIVFGIAGYLVFKIKEKQGVDATDLQSLATRVETLEETTRALSRKNESLSAQLASTDKQVDGLLDGFSRLYQQKNSDAGWQLTEIKHLLLTASHKLALERDIDTALVALEMADTRLREITDPRLLPVREQLATDVSRLKTTTAVDFTGLALFLSDLAGQVEQFPLKPGKINSTTGASPTDPRELEPTEMESRWQRLGRAIWQELKTLVVVSRANKNTPVLLPEQQYFLYQNLRLQLESARLAVLLKDSDYFQEAVITCKDWLHDHFDTSDNRVRTALDSLEEMAKIDINEAVPSIDQSLRALANYLAERNDR